MANHAGFAQLALAVGVAASGLYGQAHPLSYGDVTFELVGNDGGPPNAGLLAIYSSEGGKEHEEKVEYEVTVRLPYGRHRVEFIVYSSTPVTREITVNEPTAFFVIPARQENFIADYVSATSRTVQIAVKPVGRCALKGSLWAKMVGVYSEYSSVRVVESDGLVTFDPVDYGQYLIVVMDADRLRATQAISTVGKVTKVNITLSDCDQQGTAKP